ncbi:YiaA/YiaB family inner membrane protein [Actinomycetospora termitidis]|uniref:YiaA/YiaB family inner membrane protein n=1 Tax=Actinomycetospora termitidis TaxID=3053470 RepID=A0ABT7MAU3_9PSEU|nr:YiaA/YiaB family inner membrane protein [Actinomycetospora sp. Odt1-22]MDL5157743.1 YiaA/YiaB family inner membrane protein [Actinomycetospora sp. Odt1-22]
MASTPARPVTAAFSAQAALSFAASLLALGVGLVYLPVDGWIRGFLAVGLLWCVTSAFTLAKVVRDRQDEGTIVSRVDQARLDKLLAEHDPFTSSG